jgi:hypothetical protein
MAMKTVPMDSERPKPPSWAFSAPHLAKKMKKIGLMPFSSFKLAISGSPKHTLVGST